MTKKQKNKPRPELPQGVLAKLRKSAEKLAEPHDLEVHDVRFGPTDFGLTLSVIIKPTNNDTRAISVTDCEVVSRPLSKELDELLADFDENYLFEVTSIGIDDRDDSNDEKSTS